MSVVALIVVKEDRVLIVFYCRSQQAPVGGDVSAVQLAVRDHEFGRRHCEAVGREDGRVYPESGGTGLGWIRWSGVEDKVGESVWPTAITDINKESFYFTGPAIQS